MSTDRLYELLPAVYRWRDAERGEPLRALLRVIGEQVDVVEEDISQLYEDWFIETCQDWVVPYIGDLVGYRPVYEAGNVSTPGGQRRNKILIPRREVANTIRYRRRKGTLALLELLANDVAGWPARAVEFYKLLGLAQAINHQRLEQGRTVDLRQGSVLDLLDSPFDELAHTVDVRRIASHRTRGRYNVPAVGLFVWRLKAYSVTQTPAYYREDVGGHCYTFSVLGNDTPLYTRPEPEEEPTSIAGELSVPIPIRRRAFEARKTDYYGAGKSLEIRVGDSREPVPPRRIVPTDLTDWQYRPRQGQVAVDPELGRIVFNPRQAPSRVWVSYHYGFSADVGGGEYDRPLLQPPEHSRLDKADLKDPPGLARKLRDSSDPISRYLRDQLSEETRQLLRSEETQRLLDSEETQAPEDHNPDPHLETLEEGLIFELNRLLEGDGLYEHLRDQFSEETQRLLQDYRGPDSLSEERREAASDETNRLVEGGIPSETGELSGELFRLIAENPRGRDMVRFNRFLLERAYPDELAKSFVLYRVGRGQEFSGINLALERHKNEKPRHAVVEITDSGVYVEQIKISLRRNQTLQLRAKNRTRPVIRLLDWQTDLPDALSVCGRRGSRFTLDGLLVTGRGVRIQGELASTTIRHSTLVPGWGLDEDCEPRRPAEPSLQLFDTPHVCANIEHSIVGSIQVNQDEARTDPVRILVSDSVLDATGREREALGAPGRRLAHARLTIARSTVLGRVQAHAIELAENSIFDGCITVARRQRGCMRFCYVTPGSRTPRRYDCQPDLVEQAIRGDREVLSDVEEAALQRELLRVRPQFESVHYGTPTYCRLAGACAEEITHGADDESEMGVFHDLFQPQREANLRVRLEEYTPAGTEAGIIFASQEGGIA